MLPHLKNVYLADDDIDDIAFFDHALKTICSDCSLTAASNGEGLIKNLRMDCANADIIFIDINMPGMNGLEALKIIKENQLNRMAPVIIYSTSSSLLTIQEAMNVGAHFYVIKPNDFDKLKEKISALLFYNWKEWKMPFDLLKFTL